MVHRRSALTFATLALAGAAGCRPQPAQSTNNTVAAAPAKPKAAAPIPLQQPTLDREKLIFAALEALSASALGHDDAAAQKQLNGRDFELRLRFGCPAVPARPARKWSYDDKQHVLRARIDADLAANNVPASDLLFKGYEGTVGFVVERPLLLSAGCPVPQATAISASEPTIAIAQLFTSADSRVQRPERSYEITKKIDDQQKPTQGLELVISGRLASLSDGRPIHCAFADGPPACIIAAKFDRIAIENPTDHAVLGEWSQW